jgi:nitroimidazol reductase NimA-like FMN-containing flavoprotein (pyridoxamine 5'-phosphate oxidase superfamily)
MSTRLEATDRTTLDRVADRGSYDLATIHRILDEGLVAHVGFAVDGRPFVIPMAYARQGDRLLLHGSAISRLMRSLAEGVETCVTVTLLDGLVLARSLFHHSMNYRSVVVFGTARPIRDAEEKTAALIALSERLVPGRSTEARGPSRKELAATEILALPLTEASAKIRTGPPKDPKSDLDLPVWAGVVPLALEAGPPEPAPDLRGDPEPPPHARDYRRARPTRPPAPGGGGR